MTSLPKSVNETIQKSSTFRLACFSKPSLVRPNRRSAIRSFDTVWKRPYTGGQVDRHSASGVEHFNRHDGAGGSRYSVEHYIELDRSGPDKRCERENPDHQFDGPAREPEAVYRRRQCTPRRSDQPDQSFLVGRKRYERGC